MSDKLKQAIKLLKEVHNYIDDWNFPVGLADQIAEFLNDNERDDEQDPRPSAIELQYTEIGIPEPVTELLNPVNKG